MSVRTEFESRTEGVVARVHGWCLGAGLELAAACDLRIARFRAQRLRPKSPQ